MAKQGKKTQSARAKKKIWVPILAPKIFHEQIIAETPVTEVSQCIGRVVHSNMMTLTGDIKSQSVNAKLEITEVKDGKAHSKIVGYRISAPAIKRLVRRRRARIDESLVYQTKDGVKIRIKPFILTYSLAKGSVLCEMRKKLKLALYRIVSQRTYEELFLDVTKKHVQRGLRSTLSKLHPLRNVEIRVMHKEKETAKITPAPVLREKAKKEESKPDVKKETEEEDKIKKQDAPEKQPETEEDKTSTKKSE